MSEKYLTLSTEERSAILSTIAPRLGRAASVLEKDVWVCWVLEHLFTMPGRLPMAFKGGTSLSKVFQAINRFSEDVDITLDYRGLSASIDPFTPGLSGNKLKKLGEDLKGFVREHTSQVVLPYFQELLAAQFGLDSDAVTLSDDGEKLRVHYPSAFETSDDYLLNSVLLEFGGRNITEPNAVHEVRPDIAESIPDLGFPVAEVSVLSPSRTFWEKATLMHVECNRGEFRASAERLSRHWYDLAMLAEHEIGRRAVFDRELLADVVRHKKVFYNASYANYDDCLGGKLRLLPDGAALIALQSDFERMIDAGMFVGEPPTFADIIERLRLLEGEINRLV